MDLRAVCGILTRKSNLVSASQVYTERQGVMHCREKTTDSKYKCLPQVTLSALNETGRPESTIPVLKQRSYTGTMPVITSALAETRCIDLGMDRILEIFNMTLGTSYTLDDHDSILRSVFQSFIARNYDFGILYANVRPLLV